MALQYIAIRPFQGVTVGQDVTGFFSSTILSRHVRLGLVSAVDKGEQAPTVAAPAALTSAQVATANATAAPVVYSQAAAQTGVDLANANKATVNALQADVVALRSTVNALLTALKGTNRPMAP